MKKVGLMTLDSRTYNYGGLLQEYALYRIIEQLGYEIEIIDYDVKSEWNTFSWKRGLQYLTLKKIIRRIAKKLGVRDNSIKSDLSTASQELFDIFRKEYLSMSARYNSDTRNDITPNYDCIICGSDQIWNPSFNIPSYFLDFVPEDKGKIIYAASLGVSCLTKIQRRSYKRLLKGLPYVSVREKNARKLIQPLTSSKVEVVLDPTLLLKKEDWMNFIDTQNAAGSYIFCYFLGINEEKVKAACDFAERLGGLSIISVPFEYNYFSDVNCFANEKPMGPCDFLTYIYHAEFILTDSFHACVFSVLFNKPFRVFDRKERVGMEGRIETLLDYIGKEEYMIAPCDLKNVDNIKAGQYDFSKIERVRENSIIWLKGAMEFCMPEKDKRKRCVSKDLKMQQGI